MEKSRALMERFWDLKISKQIFLGIFQRGGGRSIKRRALDLTNVRGHECILQHYGITAEDCQYAYSMYMYYINVYAAYKVWRGEDSLEGGEDSPLVLCRKNPGKYIEKLVYVSKKCLKNCVLLSLTSMAGWTSRVPLTYVIPCLNKACPGYNNKTRAL